MLTSVLSVSALRAATSLATDQPLYLQGYYTPGDGGEGVFLCKSLDTTSDNKGTIIADGDGNRWYRQTEGLPYSVKWFGATGDGTIDDRSAIQDAIVTVQQLALGGTVWFPAGNYRINQPLYIEAPVTLLGAGNKTINGATRIVPTSMDFHAIQVLNVNYGVVVRGIDIGSGSSPPPGFGGAAIYLYQSQRVDIDDVNIYNLWNGILNDSSGDVYIRRMSIKLADVPFQGSNYRFGLMCTAENKGTPPGGNPNLTQCDSVVVNNQGTYDGTIHGFVLANGYNSLTLLNCGALHCAFGRWVTSDGGVPPAFLVETCGTTDHCNIGWAIDAGDPGANIQLNNCLCTSSYNENYYVNSTYLGDVQFTGCRAVKTGSGLAGHGAGFSLHGSGNHSLAGCAAYSTGGHNVAVSGGAMVTISGGMFSWPGQGKGPDVESPDKDSFHIYANATGSLAISGVNQHNASRGMFDDGSTCVIHGHALFLVNSITGIDIKLNHSSPPSNVWHP